MNKGTERGKLLRTNMFARNVKLKSQTLIKCEGKFVLPPPYHRHTRRCTLGGRSVEDFVEATRWNTAVTIREDALELKRFGSPCRVAPLNIDQRFVRRRHPAPSRSVSRFPQEKQHPLTFRGPRAART